MKIDRGRRESTGRGRSRRRKDKAALRTIDGLVIRRKTVPPWGNGICDDLIKSGPDLFGVCEGGWWTTMDSGVLCTLGCSLLSVDWLAGLADLGALAGLVAAVDGL